MGNKLRSIYQKMPVAVKKPVLAAVVATNNIKSRVISLFHPVKSNIYSKELLENYNKQRQFGPQRKLCYAPYSSMFFSIFGKVAPCYASYYKIDAHYPKNSIREIWQGAEFNRIRKQVNENDLSDICNFCHVPLMTNNFGSMLASKYDNYHFYGKHFPSIMEFELSNSCNLQCIMCNGFLSSSIRSHREKLPVMEMKYDSSFVNQLEEFIPHLKVAEFTGGDPLLIPLYYEIWERISKINPECNLLITTNANTMNEKFMAVMKQNHKISFNVSIDSLQKEVYESIRVGGSFEKAMQHISIFHDYCKKNKSTLNFLVCPLRKNWREFPDFVKYCNKIGICVYFHRVLKPYSHALWSLPPKELFEIYQYLSKYNFPEKEFFEKVNNENYKNLLAQIQTWYLQSVEREKQHSKLVLPFETMALNEQLLYESLEYFLDSNKELGQEYKGILTEICIKIHSAISLLPPAISKEAFFEHFLCVPLDESIFKIFASKSDIELTEMIKNWMQ